MVDSLVWSKTETPGCANSCHIRAPVISLKGASGTALTSSENSDTKKWVHSCTSYCSSRVLAMWTHFKAETDFSTFLWMSMSYLPVDV
jgi:hypothetical protein